MDHKKRHFTLFELNQHIKRVLKFNMDESIWIHAELLSVTQKNGHIYLSLVQRSDNELKAKADAVIWRTDYQHLHNKMGDTIWSILESGRQILINVLIDFHELYGYKLIIKDLDPSVTIGQMELIRKLTYKKLQEEQFIGLNAQLDVSRVWKRIAVVSSSKAAGLQDFLHQLDNNHYGYVFQYKLFESSVQGPSMKHDFLDAMDRIDKEKEHFDCIAVIRGGGARLDLVGFDDYEVCVAIATAELPVITGIGHEIDESLADFVAFDHLKTPTAAAAYLIQRNINFESILNDFMIRLERSATNIFYKSNNTLDFISNKLKDATLKYLTLQHTRIDQFSTKISLLDPLQNFKRGYVLLVNTNGDIIEHADQMQEDTLYYLIFGDQKVAIKKANGV